MKVIIDAFGGDNAPLEILKGASLAVEEFGVSVILCGDVHTLEKVAQDNGISTKGMSFKHSDSVIPVEADPTLIIKEYANSSMAVGLKLLASGGGDAFISAGSTGALVAGGSLIVKRIKGIKRPALGTVIPTSDSCYMLLDAGANAQCRPEMLLQFGLMGSAYMQSILAVEKPRIGLINIGTEPNKGCELQVMAHELLSHAPINFIGNVEARGLPMGECDVAVADGFVGNIVLKLIEGMAKMMSTEFKTVLLKTPITKLAALTLKGGVTNMRKKMDYTEYGGAPLMGLTKPVIKAHGSSNANAIKNAVRQAKLFHENNVIEKIEQSLDKISV